MDFTECLLFSEGVKTLTSLSLASLKISFIFYANIYSVMQNVVKHLFS